MKLAKCPGSLGFSQPRPQDVACPNCGTEVEIWSDEATSRCTSCGRIVIRTDTQSCIDWCRYAKECLGEDGYREYGQMKAAIRKAALCQALEEQLGDNPADVALSRTVLRFGEQFCSRREDADPMVVAAAAVLLCLAGRDPASGPERVVGILRDLQYAPDAIAKVAAIHEMLEASTSRTVPADNLEYALVHDARLLALLEHRHAAGEATFPEELVAQCLSDEGKSVAIEMRRSLRPTSTGEDQHE